MHLDTIKQKLLHLRNLDPDLTLFGASNHEYLLNDAVPMRKILAFESKYNIKLPPEYVEFMTTVGNGVAGPYYGLVPFGDCLFADLDYKHADDFLNPSEPFIHTERWNMTFEPTVREEDEIEYSNQYEEFTNEYYDRKYVNGVIALSNYGCAISIYLVVNGPEYGHVWTDDRASDNGIYPTNEYAGDGRTTFLEWYEKWLDASITKMEAGNSITLKTQLSPSVAGQNKPWWKLWR